MCVSAFVCLFSPAVTLTPRKLKFFERVRRDGFETVKHCRYCAEENRSLVSDSMGQQFDDRVMFY